VAENISWTFHPAEQFPRLAEKWQALCDSTLRTPLLSAAFVDTALRHFGGGDELVCIAETASGVVAATVVQKKNALVWQTFQPSQMPLGPWLQNPQADLAQLANSLLRKLPLPAMVLGLTQIDPDFYPRPAASASVCIDSITTGRVELPQEWDQFLNSESIRKNPKPWSALMRRLRNARRDYGDVSLHVETSAEEARECVMNYALMESRGWKGAAGTALAPDNAQARFYAELMARLAECDSARMYTLKFGDIPVARQLALAGENFLVLLKTTYDPDFREYGPGLILKYLLLQDLYRSEKIRVVEIYGRFNESQKLWVSATRGIYHANFYRFALIKESYCRFKVLNRFVHGAVVEHQ